MYVSRGIAGKHPALGFARRSRGSCSMRRHYRLFSTAIAENLENVE